MYFFCIFCILVFLRNRLCLKDGTLQGQLAAKAPAAAAGPRAPAPIHSGAGGQNYTVGYPIVSANKSEVPEVFSRIRGYPTLFVLDGTGAVRRVATGAHNYDQLQKLVLEVPLRPATIPESTGDGAS